MNTPFPTTEQKKQRWIIKAQTAWKSYLEAGAVFGGVLGGIGLWITFMALGGLWGFFLGWLPAGLLGWYVLRFIWLPLLIGGALLLFSSLDTQIQMVVLKALLFGFVFCMAGSYAQRKKNEKT
ncbi:MAG: hypothetical protein C0508_29785 [Cyanobacteria bacterium PR.023]|nr:hypothetical protein [Cyanobacteria bacterium PR.023]